MASDTFKAGDLVWARMKGYSAWPAKVVHHPRGLTKVNRHFVFFFGSYDYGWIPYDCIFSYFENIARFSKKSRQKYYQEAIIGIANAYQESIARNEASSSEVAQTEEPAIPDAQTEEPQPSTSFNDVQVINEPEVFEMREEDSDQLPKKSAKKNVKGNSKKQSSKKSGSQSSPKSSRSKDSVKLPKKGARKDVKGKEKKPSSKKSSSSSYRSKNIVSVKVQDYKKIITKEVVIMLERCDK